MAERTGQLYPGDAILEVNGIDLKHATHYQAVDALRQAVASRTVELRVQYRRDTLQPVTSSTDLEVTSGDLEQAESLTAVQALPLEGCSVWQSLVQERSGRQGEVVFAVRTRRCARMAIPCTDSRKMSGVVGRHFVETSPRCRSKT